MASEVRCWVEESQLLNPEVRPLKRRAKSSPLILPQMPLRLDPNPLVLGWGQDKGLRFRCANIGEWGPKGGFDSRSGRNARGVAPSPMDWGGGRIGGLLRRQPRAR